MSPELGAAIMFGGLIICLVAGLPVSFALGGIGVGVVIALWGMRGGFVLISDTFSVMTNILYVCMPLFIFMGVVLGRSGIADDLFEMMHRWSGSLRGGMAMGTAGICAIFAAMTGITGAATVTMGLIALPAMLKRRYDKTIALGTVAGAGTLGILIPPSIFMVILAPIGKVSLGQMFMGGVFPGLILLGLFIAYIGIRAFFQPHLCPPHEEKFTFRQKIESTGALLLPLMIIILVLGTIFFGIATPTEASAVGAAACIFAVAVRRRLTWKLVKEIAYESISITGMCMWIFFGAIAFSSTFAAIGGANLIGDLILGISGNRWVILLFMLGLLFLLGCILEPVAIVFLVAPIVYPLVGVLGFDPIWFSILFIMLLQIGCMTPPYGYQLFYLKAVSPPEVTTGDIYRSVVPFTAIMAVGTALVLLFPQVVTWLPELLRMFR